MIVIMKRGTPQKEIDSLTDALTAKGVEVNPVIGKDLIILGLVGDTSKIDDTWIEANRSVERVMHVAEPFKKANRMFHPDPSVITVEGNSIGGKRIAMIAGPCSVESEAQICGIAEDVKKAGAMFLRGGAFKPRTSPYAFQGLKYDGLELLKEARAKTGLPIVTEICRRMTSKFSSAMSISSRSARATCRISSCSRSLAIHISQSCSNAAFPPQLRNG